MVREGEPRIIIVSFQAPHAGTFRMSLEIVFSHKTRQSDREFVVLRELSWQATLPSSPAPVGSEGTGITVSHDWADDHASLSTDEEEELPDGDGTGISVSDEDGVNFGIVERKRRNGPFATPSSPLTINLAEGFPAVTFVKARIRSLDGNDSR